MKITRKVLALILSLLMMVSLAVNVVGADTYTITIGNAVAGQTYSAYKIFDAAPVGDKITYSIDSTSEWFEVVTDFMYEASGTVTDKPGTSDAKAKEYKGKGLTISQMNGGTTYSVAYDNAVFNEAMAADLAEYLSNNIGSIQPDSSATASGTPAAATINVTAPGYYFVDTTLGALSSLGTFKGTESVTINEKNKEPSVDKKVDTDNKDPDYTNGTGWTSDNDANIGDTVFFKSDITILKSSAENVELVDKMSTGLTLDESSIKVYYNNSEVAASEGSKINYVINIIKSTDKTFTIEFKNDYIAELLAALGTGVDSTTITVGYSAKLNENAEVGEVDGNPNETYLEYGDETNKTSSTSSKTITYTWGFDVYKYAETGEGASKTEIPLEGAIFVLSKTNTVPTVSNSDGTITLTARDDFIKFNSTPTEVKEGADTKAFKYKVSKDAAKTTTMIETEACGKVIFEGLEEGTYYLHEIKAPDGYNALTVPITVVIDATNIDDSTPASTPTDVTVAVTKDGETAPSGEIKVLNNAGSALPETGGIGTTIFYVIGGVMMIVAIVLLVTKKKMSKK